MTMIRERERERERERRLFKCAMLFMIPVAMWDNLQHPKLFANQVKIKYSNISLIFTIFFFFSIQGEMIDRDGRAGGQRPK